MWKSSAHFPMLKNPWADEGGQRLRGRSGRAPYVAKTGAESLARRRDRLWAASDLGLRDRQAINDVEGAHRIGSAPRNHHARDALHNGIE